jgi:hypothetical protein
MHGREAYKFDPPTFEYKKEPDYLISSFPRESFQSARNVVDLFTQAREVCVEVNNCLNDCMGQLELPNDASLNACITTIKQNLRGFAVEVDFVGIQPEHGCPPRLVLSQQGIKGNVDLACKRLNEALKLAFEFYNDEKHGTLRYDKTLVGNFQKESHYFHEVVPELLRYAEFSASVKNQTDNFLSDFIECMTLL